MKGCALSAVARAVAVVAVAVALVLGASPAAAQDVSRGYERSEGRGFVLERMPFDAPRADAVLALLDRARSDVEARLGETLGFPAPLVILAPTDDEFVRRYEVIDGGKPTGDEAAVAWPGRSTILVRGPRVESAQLGLLFVLRHELSHVVMGRVVSGRGVSLPRWLDEGLAEFAAGGELGRESELELAAQARAGTLADLAQLEMRFPRHVAGDRAYRESLSYVQWLDGHAQHGVKGVVRALAEGNPAPAAIQLVTGMTPREAELAWKVDLAEKNSIVESLARSSGFWWGLVSLLAVIAFVRQVFVSRKLKRKMDD